MSRSADDTSSFTGVLFLLIVGGATLTVVLLPFVRVGGLAWCAWKAAKGARAHCARVEEEGRARRADAHRAWLAREDLLGEVAPFALLERALRRQVDECERHEVDLARKADEKTETGLRVAWESQLAATREGRARLEEALG